MTYLELCQQTLIESETGSPDALRSLKDADEYSRQVSVHVRDAWKFIQTIHERWGWRQKEFTAVLQPNVDAYEWNDLQQQGASALNPNPAIPRDLGFRDWFAREPGEADGPEWFVTNAAGDPRLISPLEPIDYETVRIRRLIVDTLTRPSHFAVAPDKSLVFTATPDKAYGIHGRYVTGVQALTSENDIPVGISEDYHEIIKWRAVMMVHASDEAGGSFAYASAQYSEMLTSLERVWLPPITVAGSIA